MLPPEPEQLDAHPPPARTTATRRGTSIVATYAYFIVKNLVGWILILGALALGLVSPIPIGFFLFLIGFGLIWFPGKRRLVARMLSGRRIPRDSKPFRIGLAAAALIAPTLLLVYLVGAFHLNYQLTISTVLLMGGIYFAAAVVTLTFVESLLELANQALGFAPRMRRKARPWLKQHGIRLLPPRRAIPAPRKPGSTSIDLDATSSGEQEIIRLDPRHREHARAAWQRTKRWARPVSGAIITVAIFAFLGLKIQKHWQGIRDHIEQISYLRVLATALMLSVFLYAFRVTSWRRILRELGYRLPLRPATRIWSCSELARYLPGVIWQMIGRVYLVKPYGVNAVACSASQVLELAIFLVANLLIAISCLSWFGFKQMHETARHWLVFAMVLAPVLLILLHPSVFYGLANRVLRVLKRDPIVHHLSARFMFAMLGFILVGLLWQSLAIWIVASGLLHLQLAKWWVVAGAYALAWCGGFLAFWAPGGLGVREMIFVGAMQLALPAAARDAIGADPKVITALLIFISLLLRLCSIGSEIILCAAACAMDYRGLLGRQAATDATAVSRTRSIPDRRMNSSSPRLFVRERSQP